ncbi:4-(cytidine 5'-diphospho)-2-C-methyl-D-erythritol kinase [Sulfitobacter sp. JBTF-M27]|uniref:4-diphosphocytidyl-2-C-methyl-D-erythritol kinase n=1 Tax=Sulfitobacter sediminilitoris TaxID=2698830 RepID=A0A6P0CBL7_9RHOB|nr:4-(cytidine 5'-diphospho)-2-C-methyl-D-erythritol kinase [Sulfitobacter sediminilitoris]NEK22548.1 4-(cytidine 5'-diphospho)-2-C-methyl-D-erythritol kinase [Sulfitobacter sediminilitoris]
MTSEGFAPAKINLTLHVTGRRDDGYHLLDSFVMFADIGDRLWFEPDAQLSLTVTGPFAEGVPTDRRNLIWQAAEMAGQTAHITVEKNLPHGAGIGGGSSDAASVLRHYGVSAGASRLGADVPVCLASSAQRMQGIGDILAPVNGLPDLFAVLVNPRIHVPTPEVFKALQSRDNAPMPLDLPHFSTTQTFIDWLATQRNDLQDPAIARASPISDAIDALHACPHTLMARMSGSGATCFGLCETLEQAQSAASILAADHPDWWVQPCRLS